MNEETKKRLIRISRRDQVWAGLREYRDYIESLLMGKKPSPFDFLLFFRCVGVVLNEIDLYYFEFLDVDSETKAILKDDTAAGTVLRTAKEAKIIKVIEDPKKEPYDRQQAIVDMRKSIWGTLTYRKNEIAHMMDRLPFLDEAQEIVLLFTCLSTIILELDLLDTEVKIYDKNA